MPLRRLRRSACGFPVWPASRNHHPARRPLRGKDKIALRAGRILDRYKMAKHFQLRIEEESFHYERDKAKIEREQTLDGIYIIRTSVQAEDLSSEQVVAS